MKWFGAAVRVEQFEDGDRLRFRVTRERRVAALLIPIAGGVGLLVYAWQFGVSWLLLVGALALIGLPVWRWFDVRVTELRVTEQELVAEGNLNRSADTLWVPWPDVVSLQHLRGDQEEPEGLYALKGDGSRVCLVSNVHEAQAGQMIRTIYSRFPYIAMAEALDTN